MEDLSQSHSVKQIVESIASDHSSLELEVEKSLRQIKSLNPKLNAIVWSESNFIELQIESLRAKLQLWKKTISNTEDYASMVLDTFPLLGVPITVKELDSPIKGTPNSWGNKILKDLNYKDSFTAHSVELVQNAGAIIVGKTNNPEFGLPIITYSSAHGPSLNPLDPSRNSGGSSGGGASCVASGMTRVTLGSDGGGSIRIPSSNCGLWGLKPSRGRISNGPISEHAWSGLATKGIIAASLEDLIYTFDVLAQPLSGEAKINYAHAAQDIPQTLKIGVRRLGLANAYEVNPAINEALDSVLSFLSNYGYSVEEEYPSFFDDDQIMKHQGRIIAHHTNEDLEEAIRRSENRITFDDCEPLTKYFLDLHQKMNSTDFDIAINHLEKYTSEMAKYFDDFDLLITPTCGDIAPKLGFVENDITGITAYIYAGLTLTANMAGVPALSFPVKTNHPSGLPTGIQLIAKHGLDERILQIGSLLAAKYSNIFDITSHIVTN